MLLHYTISNLATVITNLLSAIPWIGVDFVESIYVTTLGTSLLSLSTIGTVSPYALKKPGKLKRGPSEKKEYLSIPLSFLGFLIGFIDGDGYIQITKTTRGYISIKLVISLHLEDLSTLEYIQSVLKLGKLTIYKDLKSPTCKLIFNRTDLQEIIFPLFIHYKLFFLTETRRSQFDLAIFILQNEIKFYDDIYISKKDIPSNFELPETAIDYVNLKFFNNWIVGFTMAEGSFMMKINNDACFQLKQRTYEKLFEAFKLVFETDRKIYTEKNRFNQFGVSSKSDIQKVITFFSFSGFHPLIGLKGIQYFKWLNLLANSNRYKNLKFPQ